MSPSVDHLPEEFPAYRKSARRFCRRLYQNGRKHDSALYCNGLPLVEVACRAYSRAAGGLSCLSKQDATSLTRSTRMSPAAVVMALVYLERLTAENSQYVDRTQPSHIFLASTLAAGKVLFDDGEEEHMCNDDWAHCTRLPVDDVNHLEAEFLSAIDWRVNVTDQCFADMLCRVEALAALSESSKRGWITYSEAVSMAARIDVSSLLTIFNGNVVKVICACSVAYMASFLTIAAAVASLQSTVAYLNVQSLRVGPAPPASDSLFQLPPYPSEQIHLSFLTDIPSAKIAPYLPMYSPESFDNHSRFDRDPLIKSTTPRANVSLPPPVFSPWQDSLLISVVTQIGTVCSPISPTYFF